MADGVQAINKTCTGFLAIGLSPTRGSRRDNCGDGCRASETGDSKAIGIIVSGAYVVSPETNSHPAPKSCVTRSTEMKIVPFVPLADMVFPYIPSGPITIGCQDDTRWIAVERLCVARARTGAPPTCAKTESHSWSK
jgi:hypothetical protein